MNAVIYRAYTKEWCGFFAEAADTAPLFCVCPVLRTYYISVILRIWGKAPRRRRK
jgi:hypothetical protein